MKTIKRHIKIVVLFLSAFIFLQGCTVYKSGNVPLEEAVKANTKVRIKTNDHQTLKFKNMEVENGMYYGLMNYKNKKWVKTQINENNIKKLQVKDKTMSTIISFGIPVILIGIAAIVDGGIDIGFSNGVKCNPCN